MQAPSVRALLRFAAYQFAFSVVGLAYWVRDTFDNVILDQVLWHWRYAESTAIRMSEIFIVQFAVDVLLVPLVCAVLAGLVHGSVAPLLSGWPRRFLRAAPALSIGAAAMGAALQFSLPSYAAAYFAPDRFALDYVDPAHVPITQERRRNLVLIYAESLEATYGDPEIFGRDLLAPLRALGGRSYPWYQPAAGANWTMAAMVATQCGVPLKVYSETDVRRRADAKSFLPGATCLGDILKLHGFRNVFLGGVPLTFAGKGRFLRDHGYAEALGREDWERAGARPDDYNSWGLWDSGLFARARSTLDRLHGTGQPFNLTMLTLDTHNPSGFLSPECRRRGATDFPGIVNCSARQIAEFVEYARGKGYLKDTTFVVIGDHLAVGNPVHDLLAAAPRRGIFNLFVGTDLPPMNTDQVMPFDFFPTLVELAGMQVAGDRLGLGFAAVGSAEAEPTPARAADWALTALRGSSRYDRLWAAHAPSDGAKDAEGDD